MYRENQYIPPKSWRVTRAQKRYVRFSRFLSRIGWQKKHLVGMVLAIIICILSFTIGSSWSLLFTCVSTVIVAWIPGPRLLEKKQSKFWQEHGNGETKEG